MTPMLTLAEIVGAGTYAMTVKSKFEQRLGAARAANAKLGGLADDLAAARLEVLKLEAAEHGGRVHHHARRVEAAPTILRRPASVLCRNECREGYWRVARCCAGLAPRRSGGAVTLNRSRPRGSSIPRVDWSGLEQVCPRPARPLHHYSGSAPALSCSCRMPDVRTA